LNGRCTVLTFVPIKLGEEEEEEVTVSLYIFVNYSSFVPCSATCLMCRTAVRLRSACLAMLYRKVIRLSGHGEKSTGEVSMVLMCVTDSEGLTTLIPGLTIGRDLEQFHLLPVLITFVSRIYLLN
jgi:hypothetical protein